MLDEKQLLILSEKTGIDKSNKLVSKIENFRIKDLIIENELGI